MEQYNVNVSERIGYLAARGHIHGLTPAEAAELQAWKDQHPRQAEKLELLFTKDQLQASLKELDETEEKIRQDFIDAGMPVHIRRRSSVFFSRVRSWQVAAAIMLLACIGGYFRYFHTAETKPMSALTNKMTTPPILPGKEGAILTLADGSTLFLDSMNNGTIATQGSTKIRLQHGELAYDALNAGAGSVSYNTMTTPRGRQFHIILPDGTHVWLNAASSLKFPTLFNGSDRRVEVTGEAYFEVAPDARRPFMVGIGQQTAIEVIGTHFNVNAYEDEETINTTLTEGAIRIRSDQQKRMLSPGQQARIGKSTTGNILVKKDVDIAGVMAWKNGFFNFQDATLAGLMRQIARWYDIEVVYAGTIPAMEFWGKMGRDLPLADVLSFLEKSNVHFKVEGRKLIVAN